jgi:hypothetical protein
MGMVECIYAYMCVRVCISERLTAHLINLAQIHLFSNPLVTFYLLRIHLPFRQETNLSTWLAHFLGI